MDNHFIKKMQQIFAIIITFLLFYCSSNDLFALKKPITTDSRIKVFVYNEYEIYPLFFHYKYMSHLDFPSDEKIETVSLGESMGWKLDVANKGTRVYIQPIERGVQTNMNIMTNKRNYEFDIFSHDEEFLSNDLDIAYSVRFFYPKEEDDREMNKLIDQLLDDQNISFDDKEQKQPKLSEQFKQNIDDFLKNIKKYSKIKTNYTYAGSASQVPNEVFSDNKMTYIIFDKAEDLPESVGFLDKKNNFEKLQSIVNRNVLIINKSPAKIMVKYPNDQYLILYKN